MMAALEAETCSLLRVTVCVCVCVCVCVSLCLCACVSASCNVRDEGAYFQRWYFNFNPAPVTLVPRRFRIVRFQYV